MSYKSIKDLEPHEMLAIAFAEYDGNRFIANKLTIHLCMLFRIAFAPGILRHVEERLAVMLELNLIRLVPGPRGGAGFAVTELGAGFVSTVELPTHLYQRRSNLDDERSQPAKSNVGPFIEQVRAALKAEAFREHNFIDGLATQWMEQGWLSTKQVHSLAELALKCGIYMERTPYVGSAPYDWREPYIEERRRRVAEERRELLERKAQLARERERLERERTAVREFNQQISTKLRSAEYAPALANLESLVDSVFPGTSIAQAARTAAIAGNGSKRLRVCIAALTLGLPPDRIWASTEDAPQPNASSELWQAVITSRKYSELSSPRPQDAPHSKANT